MSKEIYISTTPHETRLAIVEDEQLAEIYYERENEYTLAGSIYNGKVTRVLPGMQSSFVDIGLERDAFLYVTDFMDEQGEAADFESDSGTSRQQRPPREASSPALAQGRDTERQERSSSRRGGGRERREFNRPEARPTDETETTVSFDEPIAPAQTEETGAIDTAQEGGGSRRWRGRRGRRRGRAARTDQPVGEAGSEETIILDSEEGVIETGSIADGLYADGGGDDAGSGDAIVIDLQGEADTSGTRGQFGRGGRSDRGRGRRERGGNRDRVSRDSERAAPMFDNSYAGYLSEETLPEGEGATMLPGESIRKYRDPAEVAAEDAEAKRNAPEAPAPVVVSAPSVEIVGWDGGAVLPGETLSRRSPRSEAGSRREPRANRGQADVAAGSTQTFDAAPAATPAPAPIKTNEEFAPAVAPEEPTGLTGLPAHGVSASEVEAAATTEPGALPGQSSSADAEQAHGTGAQAEYEPEEGARAAVTGSDRRDLRRYEQPAEPAAAAEPRQQDAAAQEEAEAISPDPTTYDLHAASDENTTASATGQAPEPDPVPALEPTEPEFTNLSAGGEMTSLLAESSYQEFSEESLHSRDGEGSVSVVSQEGAIYDSTSMDPQDTTPSFPVADETELSDEGGIHAYGDGDLQEEEMDEDVEGDEYEYPAVLAHTEDGEDEYEEETLDGSADLGSVLQELTQHAHEFDSEEEHEEPESNAGGFTEEDFTEGRSLDLEEDTASDTGAGSEGDRRPQRESQRQSGGGRYRNGGRGGGDRGRGGRRQSMQTTDLPAINELLKPGQEILVQIAKEPIAKKGARITSHIALPGRFLVFMPTVNHTGVSRKISSDDERRRLKSILLSEKGDAQGGFIVRTAADGASEEELRNDLRFLIQMWTDIKMRSESSKSPALIYHDLNLVERILRDQVTDNFSAIWVDTEQEYERVLRFLQRFQPSLVRRVKLYTKETPLFEHFGVTAEIDKALKSKVWLKSGGSIVINQTEALVAIDINTGKYVGKTARLEDTILKTNLDAIPEIVRQIRLRDLGGIIVIDFIDMDERKNRAKVLQTLEDAMRVDRAPSKILPFNDFGLVIMTRKRVKQSLERTLCIPDPITEGTGMIKSPVTIANEIYIEMRKMYRHLEKTDVMLRVHPEVIKTLKANGAKRLQELEDMTRKTILVKSDPSLSPEAFDIH